MFKFVTTTFLNGKTYVNGEPAWFTTSGGTISYPSEVEIGDMPESTTNIVEKSITLNHGIKFLKDNILSITKAKWVDPRKAELKIDLTKANLKAGLSRLYIYIRSVENADPMYANDWVFKGRPFYVEFNATGNAVKDASALVKAAKKWITLLYDGGKILKFIDEGNGTVTVKATTEYQRFNLCELLQFDENALIWAYDGAFKTVLSSDKLSDVYNEKAFDVTEVGTTGQGTYTKLIQNLRLPTNANTRLYKDQVDEIPSINGKYWQYVITQCSERPEMQGTSVLGQYNKSVTTHVIFVEDAIQSEFDTALSTLHAIEDASHPTVDTSSVKEEESIIDSVGE